uniref:MIF4G domain-containing protein n=1 Tax=Felis catus TaxID=9685 RepID=A0ABI7YS72_FELCA
MDLTALRRENMASLLGQLQNIAKENCINESIHIFLKCLVHGMQESRLDFPGGFILIKGELTELGWKFFNLMHHNQQVFKRILIRLYAELLRPAQQTPRSGS